MDEQEKINIAKKEFSEKAENYKMLLEYREKFFETFLKIKLSFVAFLSVILTIIFSKSDGFSNNFKIFYYIIIAISFIFLIIDLWIEINDKKNALKEQYRRVILSKIRHIATLEPDKFIDYGKRSEELLIQDNIVREKMLNKNSIDEILKYKDGIFWLIEFWIWSILFLIIPLLFLLEFFKKL